MIPQPNNKVKDVIHNPPTELSSEKTVQDILAHHGISPKKSLGQNFLVDPVALQKITDASDLSGEDTVLEIGPGLGTLTRELVKRAGLVVTVEKDDLFAAILSKTLGRPENLKVIHEDILKWDETGALGQKPYKIVANLPYAIASRVIRKFLAEATRKPALMVVMVQKEVGRRICAKPPKTNLLAASVQYEGDPSIVGFVEKSSFWPVPDVDSAILKIAPFGNRHSSAEQDQFFRVMKAGFAQPRKQLGNNLAPLFQSRKEETAKALWSLKIDPARRAGTLSIAEWEKMAKSLKTI